MIKDSIYTLTKVDFNDEGEIDNRTTQEFSTISLDEVMSNMTYFLRGCSFIFPMDEELTLADVEGEIML